MDVGKPVAAAPIQPILDLDLLKASAADFLRELSGAAVPVLFGVTDGKAVGTFVEHAFHTYLAARFVYVRGNSATGSDFPALFVDLKVTSVRQPQSSSPFYSASQKVYGLGYHLMVFVYDKSDDDATRTAVLTFSNAIFVDAVRTADHQLTLAILQLLERNGTQADLLALFDARKLPLDELGRQALAERVLREPPQLGYLTIANALQWRLQYGRALGAADSIDGIDPLL